MTPYNMQTVNGPTCGSNTAQNRHNSLLQSQRQSRRGQSLVEFALILPLVLLLVVGAADLGRAFTAHIAIGSAAREGAAFGMQSAAAAADQTGMRNAALAAAPAIWGVAPTVGFPACTDGFSRPDGTSYACVAVRVSYEFQPLIPIGPIPSSITMQRTVRMRVIN